MPLLTTIASGGVKGLGWSAASASEELGGMVLLTPTSVTTTGTSPTATINPNGSVTVATASSLSVNGVFTSDYDNYMIAFQGLRAVSAAVSCVIYYRSSGSDTTTSTYTEQYLFAGDTSVTASRNTRTFGGVFRLEATYQNMNLLYIYGPNLAQPTAARTVTGSSSGGASIDDRAYTQSDSTQFDGFTMLEGFDQLSGTLCVYGLVGA